MKKSLLAIAALAIALTASAATTMETSTRSYTPTNAKVNVNSLRSNSLFAKKAKKVRAKVSSASDLAGTYIETNIPMEGFYSAGTSTVTATGDSITFKNFAGISDDYSFDVKAKVDVANGTFTIPSGTKLYKSGSSYGDCPMYCISVDDQGKVSKTTDPIQGVINDDGSMVITSPWACFIVTGQYAGYYFGDLMFQSNFFNKPNARMTYNQTGKGAQNVMLYVEQTDSAVMLSNFADFGCVVGLAKNADSTVVIPKQNVLEQGDKYGTFFTIGYDAAGEDTISNINGTGAGHPAQINLTNTWTILSTTGYWINKCSDTKIFFADANGGVSTDTFFTYPHELTGVKDVTAQKVVAGKHYVNLQGQVSNEPFEGVNIVVTRYTDGSQSATKMLK